MAFNIDTKNWDCHSSENETKANASYCRDRQLCLFSSDLVVLFLEYGTAEYLDIQHCIYILFIKKYINIYNYKQHIPQLLTLLFIIVNKM